MSSMRRYIPFLKSTPRVAVLRLEGVIATGSRGAPLSASSLAPLIDRAFRKGRPKAVALAVNSPGGSPVQSALIAEQIRRLSETLDIPVHAFVEDVAASGGYWLACAADQIWVDQSSIVGSIGVISASFGFHEFLEKQGVERRVHTAGRDKSLLDPFRPERPEDVERLRALQIQIHDAFIAYVKSRRNDRLSETNDLFSGDIWIGAQAVEVGLVDGIAHLQAKMTDIYGKDVKFIHHGRKKTMLGRFGLFLEALIFEQIEARSIWARFGL